MRDALPQAPFIGVTGALEKTDQAEWRSPRATYHRLA